VNNQLTSIALVTGANKGLGKEVARQLARRGFRVYIGSRDQARGEQAVRELAAPGLELIPVQLDVTSDESVAALAEHFSRELKHVDVLINNAGIPVSRPALEITVAEMRQTYETNVFGAVRMIQAMLPFLQGSQHPHCQRGEYSGVSRSGQRPKFHVQPRRHNSCLCIIQGRGVDADHTIRKCVQANGDSFTYQDQHSHSRFHCDGSEPIQGYSDRTGGVRIVIELATLEDDGPTGGFFNDAGPLPW
jgi:NAD(P)-dependent dehydrogenase (short-subunit alcohol dehydrogenase family)